MEENSYGLQNYVLCRVSQKTMDSFAAQTCKDLLSQRREESRNQLSLLFLLFKSRLLAVSGGGPSWIRAKNDQSHTPPLVNHLPAFIEG